MCPIYYLKYQVNTTWSSNQAETINLYIKFFIEIKSRDLKKNNTKRIIK